MKWSSSNEAAATVDANGVITGKVTSAMRTPVTITATSLDGSNVLGSVEIIVLQIVQPQDITIDQKYAAPNYYCAINEKSVELAYTTVPAECTKSLIEWTSSDESIATVEGGIVKFNQSGNFGDFTITARCPETGKESTIKMSLAAGLIRPAALPVFLTALSAERSCFSVCDSPRFIDKILSCVIRIPPY